MTRKCSPCLSWMLPSTPPPLSHGSSLWPRIGRRKQSGTAGMINSCDRKWSGHLRHCGPRVFTISSPSPKKYWHFRPRTCSCKRSSIWAVLSIETSNSDPDFKDGHKKRIGSSQKLWVFEVSGFSEGLYWYPPPVLGEEEGVTRR